MEAFYAPRRTYFSRYVSFLVLLGTLITYAVYSFIPIEFTGRSPKSNTSSISPSELRNSSLYADGCYIIRSKQTNKALQAMSNNTVQQQVANGQSNQIWKQEAVGAQYRFTSQAGNKDQVMQVNSAGAGELIRLGSYTGDFKQKWDMLDGGNGFIQVGLANNNITWDVRSYGNDPELQLYGTAGAPFNDYRLFSFESVSCPGAPTGGGTTFSQCIEAESSQNTGNRTTLADPNASGGNQAATYGNSGEYTVFNIQNVTSTGPYTLTLTYASGDNPQADIIVNGGAAQRVSMPTTSSWNGTYREYSTTINLSATVNPNTIRIQGTNLGAFNLDKICVQGGSTTTPNTNTLSISNINGISNASPGASTGGITVNSNVSWTVSNDSGGWLTVNPSSGSNTGNVSVSIAANSGAARSATITVSGGGLSQTVQVSQQGSSTTPTCTVSSPNGYFDDATCDVVNGWALDQSDFNKTVTVDIYVDNVKTYSVQANGSRPDVADNAYGGNPAARNHGFSFTIPANASWKNGSSHNIRARICGAGGDLNSSPKSVAGCTGSTSSYKVLFVGNSITYHSADPNSGWNGNWGMAATAANKDYKNLLVAKLQAAYPNLQARELRDFSGLNEASGPDWEQRYDQKPLSEFQPATDFAADLIIMRLAENVDDGQVNSRNFKAYYLQLIDKLKANNPSARVILSNSVWGQSNVTNLINQVAQERGYPLANLFDMWSDPSNYAFGQYSNQGVAKHPNDKGMQEIANRICAQIGGLSCSTPPVLSIGSVTGLNSVGTGGGNGSFPINSNVSWTISGVPSWLTLNTTSGSNNGTINVSIQSNGGPARSATLTVSGGGLSATVQISQQGTGTTAFTGLETIENSFVRVGVDARYGGAITHVVDKQINSPNMINNTDLGRQLQLASYAGPLDYSQNGDHPQWNGLGYNPVQAGSFGSSDVSSVIAFSKTNNSLYVKTQPKQFAFINNVSESYTEHWISLVNNVIKVHVKITYFRSDHTQYNARTQELPCLYAIGRYYKGYVYRGGNPFSGENPDMFEADAGSNGLQSTHPVTEPWMALTDVNDYGLGLYVPGCYRWAKGHFNANRNVTDEFSDHTTYIAATNYVVFDWNINHEFDYEIVVGHINGIKSYVQSKQPSAYINYRFDNSRKGWYYYVSNDQGRPTYGNPDTGWPINNQLNISLAGGDVQIKSPHGFWKGSNNPKLYVKAAFNTSLPSFDFTWRTRDEVTDPSNEEFQTYSKPNRVKNFNITGDGVSRVYEIDLSNQTDWIGKDIIQLQLRIPYYLASSANGRVNIEWISTNPNGPSNQSNSSFTASEARVGVAESEAEMQVRVLGNPVADQLRFEVTGAEGKKVQVKVLNTTGRVVESREIGSAAPVEVQSIDLSREQRGLLLLQVTTGDQSKTVKVIR